MHLLVPSTFLYSTSTTSSWRTATFRHKQKVRAIVRVLSFLSLVSFYIVYDLYNNQNTSSHFSNTNYVVTHVAPSTSKIGINANTNIDQLSYRNHHRYLSIFPKVASPQWLLLPYVIGVLYTFLALAIVCDEFFVPALEEVSSERHLHLSMDVSGATLMAAGGSAPELFTSMIGTFWNTEIGFGTIVGSAVFNVLFVIGVCSVFSKEVLTLTWWPLIRDSAYYAVSLVVLAVFVGLHGKGEVELWEALVLLGMYVGYIVLMVYNRRLYTKLTGKTLVVDDEEEEAVSCGGCGVVGTDDTSNGLGSKQWPGTFRAGVLKLLRDPDSCTDTAGVGLVAKIAGDVDDVFTLCDRNGDGTIDKEELRALMLRLLDFEISDEEIDGIRKELDTTGDGLINKKEFTNWYVGSEKRIKEKVRTVFDMFDTDQSNSIDRSELRKLLETLEPHVLESDIDLALKACCKSKPFDHISFGEFVEWYLNSLIYEKGKAKVKGKVYGVCESLAPPNGGSILDYVKYIVLFPLVAVMTYTIPDVRKPGMGNYCYFSFLMSIVWIGVYSYFMVIWAEIIGTTVGIPSYIMGLTFLATGTSVPDLLSSVIVARRGHGDMAVSSSIGSNIFDILVGLPLPWVIYTAWPSKPDIVTIGSDNVWVSIFILLCMLVLIITAIHFQGWKLTRSLGISMFMMYFLFLAQAIIFEYWL